MAQFASDLTDREPRRLALQRRRPVGGKIRTAIPERPAGESRASQGVQNLVEDLLNLGSGAGLHEEDQPLRARLRVLIELGPEGIRVNPAKELCAAGRQRQGEIGDSRGR